ncbi:MULTISPECIES: FtsW/RodA/SpoVE family cell cycle protein [Bizionia]|uniref:Probable peptidoglycan glycosyltransferase FtsW n=1 Tax=Bizionia algoritergicola TaxID=291187 RepID=A0A5D0R1P3_9FLAO|nr:MULTISPECIES: FtsW/RodA/SpoVE family cell cycle protein [Bizionia]OBX22480.1 cell division protein FtsW [Bizionia sp. APA-3]TYB74618.1 cell division protein FtsW [Bizionia algoritergicola]
MHPIIKNIKGDKYLWAIVALLAIFSFLPVYSAASNLAYNGAGKGTFSIFFGHIMHLVLGFLIVFIVHKMPYKYFRAISILLLPVVLMLLVLTLMQGSSSSGTNTSRWIQIPVVGMSFQTSTFAFVVLMVYVAHYMAKIKDRVITFKESILPLWTPVFFVLALILPANFSTAAIMFCMVVILVFLGGYPVRYLGVIIGLGIVTLTLFVLTAKAFPDAMPNRVDTWMSRVESFSDDAITEEDYQIEKAKIAIATGGVKGVGPGKSYQKNFLPQSSSDFIFAIIVEEYGLIGGFSVLFLYLALLFRIVIVSQKSETIFGKLVALGVGLPIVFQALINMAVAVQLFPVTGQTLPLISSGGTSIWMTCLALGIILSVSAKREEIVNSEQHEESPLDILTETL